DTSQSRSVRAVANETREWRGFTRVVGLQYFNGDFEVASERHTTSLLFPELVLSRQAADDLRFPLRGSSLSLTVRATPESWLSDTSVLQARVDAKWIRSLSERQRFILRGSLGGMVVDDFSQLPPELRFFAGGDRSIRGFDYQSIGTLNGQGEVIGGKQLVVASTEYEYYFLQNWGAATFVDAGDAYDSGSFMPRVGVGVGVRWR